MYLCLAVLGLLSLLGFSLAAESRGCFLAVVCSLLTAVASLVSGHGLQGVWASGAVVHGLRSCGSQTREPQVQ